MLHETVEKSLPAEQLLQAQSSLDRSGLILVKVLLSMDEAGATRGRCFLFSSSDSASSLLSNGSDFRFFVLSSRVLLIRPISINLLYASRAAFFSASFLVFAIPVPNI